MKLEGERKLISAGGLLLVSYNKVSVVEVVAKALWPQNYSLENSVVIGPL